MIRDWTNERKIKKDLWPREMMKEIEKAFGGLIKFV